MPADFISLTKPSSRQPKFQLEASSAPLAFLKDALRLETFLLIGACLQVVLVLLLPLRVAVAPAIVFGLYRLIYTSLQVGNVIPHDYAKDVISAKTSAQFPDRDDGRFGHEAAAQPVVVFLLGASFNHPLGIFSPGAKEMGDHATAMNAELMARADEFGLLGVSNWQGGDRADTNMILLIYYFRDVEGINKFAHSDVHMRGWNWYNKARHSHIGIMHETFSVPAGAYETIYKNFKPTLMGATAVKVVNEETGEEEWMRPIVSAEKGPLKTQFGRMGRSAGKEHENYDFAKEGAV